MDTNQLLRQPAIADRERQERRGRERLDRVPRQPPSRSLPVEDIPALGKSWHALTALPSPSGATAWHRHPRQAPMPPTLLSKALPPDVSPSDWYRLLNGYVFLWASIERAERHRTAFARSSQVLLIFDAALLLGGVGRSRPALAKLIASMHGGDRHRGPLGFSSPFTSGPSEAGPLSQSSRGRDQFCRLKLS
jgi:hypothetical protein